VKRREDWDVKYRDAAYLGDPSPQLVEALSELRRGRALDAACGLGANALFLAREGFEVDALDWSFEALRKCAAAAELQRLRVHPAVCDLTRLSLPPSRYDLVVSIRYLDRLLWPRLVRSLKPGGALWIETLTRRYLEKKPDFPEAYLLEEGELLTAFASTLRVVRYRESSRGSTASLLALR
jgi:2-polyprenyl-3-methyl-5-hydroxy-6-metoxy-1,4-benzoquinol methylase